MIIAVAGVKEAPFCIGKHEHFSLNPLRNLTDDAQMGNGSSQVYDAESRDVSASSTAGVVLSGLTFGVVHLIFVFGFQAIISLWNTVHALFLKL